VERARVERSFNNDESSNSMLSHPATAVRANFLQPLHSHMPQFDRENIKVEPGAWLDSRPDLMENVQLHH